MNPIKTMFLAVTLTIFTQMATNAGILTTASVREATAAEMQAGTQGLPAVVTPQSAGRIKSRPTVISTTNISVSITIDATNAIVSTGFDPVFNGTNYWNVNQPFVGVDGGTQIGCYVGTNINTGTVTYWMDDKTALVCIASTASNNINTFLFQYQTEDDTEPHQFTNVWSINTGATNVGSVTYVQWHYTYVTNVYKTYLDHVTVSPTGKSSGASLTNNGADYGPDTPGTTTCGIQEAINSAYEGSVYRSGLCYGIDLELYQGVFMVNGPIYFSNTLPFEINMHGSGMMSTAIWGSVSGSNNVLNFVGGANTSGGGVGVPEKQQQIYLSKMTIAANDTNGYGLFLGDFWGGFKCSDVNFTTTNYLIVNGAFISQLGYCPNPPLMNGVRIDSVQEHEVVFDNCFFTGVANGIDATVDHLIMNGCKATMISCYQNKYTNGYALSSYLSAGALVIRHTDGNLPANPTGGLDGSFYSCHIWSSKIGWYYFGGVNSHDRIYDCQFESDPGNQPSGRGGDVAVTLDSLPPTLINCVHYWGQGAPALETSLQVMTNINIATSNIFVHPGAVAFGADTTDTNCFQVWSGANLVFAIGGRLSANPTSLMGNGSGITNIPSSALVGAGLNHTPVAVTVSASPFSFTNKTPNYLQVWITDTAAYSVTVHGTAVASSISSDFPFVLQPTNYCTITYASTTPTVNTNAW